MKTIFLIIALCGSANALTLPTATDVDTNTIATLASTQTFTGQNTFTQIPSIGSGYSGGYCVPIASMAVVGASSATFSNLLSSVTYGMTISLYNSNSAFLAIQFNRDRALEYQQGGERNYGTGSTAWGSNPTNSGCAALSPDNYQQAGGGLWFSKPMGITFTYYNKRISGEADIYAEDDALNSNDMHSHVKLATQSGLNTVEIFPATNAAACTIAGTITGNISICKWVY